MTQLTAAEYYAQIQSSTAAVAAMVAADDLSRPIPTCPEWTLRELAIHIGRAHRWAAQITSTRSKEFIEFRTLPDGKFPGAPQERADWLTAGARRLVDAVDEAGQDPVWSFGELVPASFWGRRMCHETLVHHADAALAAGQAPDIGAAVAADAIDEWLTELMRPIGDEADARAAALDPGCALHVHATDAGPGTGEWLIRHGEDGVTVLRGHGKADAAVTGPAARLLLVLLRRLPADDPAVTVHGDPGILDRWLAGTPF
jgi:uncharacterized protein (TIGR03083 family)